MCVSTFVRSLRRVLFASCASHALLAAYVLTKCVHAFMTAMVNRPEYLHTTVADCKIQVDTHLPL